MADELEMEELGVLMQPKTAEVKTVDMFFLIDTSLSMTVDDRIGKVKQALSEIKNNLTKGQLKHISDYKMRISVAGFGEDVKWLTEAVDILEYLPKEIVADGRQTNYEAVYRSLNKRMSRNDLIAHEGKRAIPYVLFITDGKPVGKQDWKVALDELKKNGWFYNSFRYALLIGDSYDDPAAREAVKDFVKNPEEGIISAKEANDITEKIRIVTMKNIKKTLLGGVANDAEIETGGEKGSSQNTVPPMPPKDDPFKKGSLLPPPPPLNFE